MTRTCTLGVDIGTTSVKVVAFAPSGEELARASARLTMVQSQPGWAEQDPDAVYAAVEQALLRVDAALQVGGWQVGQVGFSAAMHSLLAVDANHRPLTPAITWMDTRAARQADALWRSPQGSALYAATGTPVHPMTPLVKLMWWSEQRSTERPAAAKWVSLKEYVWFRWFGVWEVDASMASATGLYDLMRGSWLDAALETAGIREDQLSALVPTTHCRVGLTAPGLQTARSLANAVFNIGASDGVLANLGVGAASAGDLVLTIGTSCAVRATTEHPATDAATRLFCYVLDDRRFVVGGPSNSGGVVVDWLCRQVLGVPPESEAFEQMLAEAAAVETDDLLVLPYLTGERAPLWNPEAAAHVLGLRPRHTRAHLFRAAVEGILFNAAWISSAVQALTGPARRVLTSGKLLDVPWIRQLAADIFGLPAVATTSADASVVGAALLAEMAALGSDGQSSSAQPDRFHPTNAAVQTAPNATQHTRYLRKAASFRQAVHQLGLTHR
ncbi:gluconate kinase [Alicyclobacillus contaminans]|uniref:gluconokinase n=1 Tax=Alicyclobacillus contaminans TaxID=392016 RepID=UPI000407647E|nr:gluconokinase [Alicyclobacillus contaminans]GMA51093.1 gluconate kinase [Alicyclobacillus contaminans]